jgi:16S rRNA (uracil1498-N3)-methyltransferase
MAELRRLLISPERLDDSGETLTLEADERHYLERVMRLRPGARFGISDGAGRLYEASLLEQGQASINTMIEQQPRQQPQLVLMQGLMRRDLDITLRMATELGVDRLVPLQADRSVLAPRDQRSERWSSQLREATEQCERLWLPQLEPVQKGVDALSKPAPARGQRWIGVTREPTAISLQEALEASSASDSVWEMACGPEGGWSPAELDAAALNGWRPVSLGPTILRASTAAVAALSLLQHRRHYLSASDHSPSA